MGVRARGARAARGRGAAALPALLALVPAARVAGAPGPDPLVAQTLDPDVAPCSCDCCLVQERAPFEEESLGDGRLLTHKCGPAPTATDMCPTQCSPSSFGSVVSSAGAVLDYSRVCAYKCKPSAPTAGAMCVRLTALEARLAETPGGNGRAVYEVLAAAEAQPVAQAAAGAAALAPAPAPAPEAAAAAVGLLLGPGGALPSTALPAEWQADAERRRADLEARAEAAELAAERGRRRQEALRLGQWRRLEAGAAAEAAQATAEARREQATERAAEHNAALSKEAADAMVGEAAGDQQRLAAVLGAAAVASQLAASATGAVAQVAEAEGALVAETRKLTVEAILQRTWAAALGEARASVRRLGPSGRKSPGAEAAPPRAPAPGAAAAARRAGLGARLRQLREDALRLR